MRALAARAASVLIALLPLSLAAGAAGQPRAESAYPLTAAYHFTGTPLRVATFDAGPVGRVVITYEANVLGVVRNSYVAISTRSFDIVARAGANRRLTEVKSFQRAGADQPKPNLDDLVVGRFAAREVPAMTVLNDPFAVTRVFFVRSRTGDESLVSEPFRDGAAIPFGAALRLSFVKLEIFPIGADGHGSEATKEERQQPPLTPNLDKAADLVDDAKALETRAVEAYKNKAGRKFVSLLYQSTNLLNDAVRAAGLANVNGELQQPATVTFELEAAEKSDYNAINPARADPKLWKKIRDDPARVRNYVLGSVEKALGYKEVALRRIASTKSAREEGK